MRVRAILSRNLKRLRRVRGLSQEALAHEAGVDRTYVSDLERERSSATIDMLATLARILEVEPSDLIDREFRP